MGRKTSRKKSSSRRGALGSSSSPVTASDSSGSADGGRFTPSPLLGRNVLIDPDVDLVAQQVPYRSLSSSSLRSNAVRTSASTEEYFEAHDVAFFARDFLSAASHPPLAEYFASVARGGHLLGRSYAFCSANPYNRRVFVQNCCAAFGGSLLTRNVSLEDYHSLLCLVCIDFPLSVVVEAATASLHKTEGALPRLAMEFSFPDIHRSVMLWFFFRPFFVSMLSTFGKWDAANEVLDAAVSSTAWAMTLPAESLVAAMARLRSQDARKAHLGQILRVPLSYPPTKLVNDAITDCSRVDDADGTSIVTYRSVVGTLLESESLWKAANQSLA